MDVIFKWLRKFYNKLVHSIAFLPAIMAVGFLLIAIAALEMDVAGLGLELNRKFKWLTLKDPSTARTIVATVAAGIISLTVFSFSMVMIVMSQVASQMSNRMLGNIIGDRVQKVVLGFYIGAIVFALFLLTNISETESDTNVPSLSVYLLLVLTVFDIFLFVYFLHYITQSFRYEQLIQRIHKRAVRTLKKLTDNNSSAYTAGDNLKGHEILSPESGYYQGFDEKRLLKLAQAQNITIEFLHPKGTYVLKGTPLLNILGQIDNQHLKKMLLDIDFYNGQEIDKNVYYGFLHLTEVAVKALSPGINDPGTAVLCINALTDLFARIMQHPVAEEIKDDKGNTRIVTKQISFDELFDCAVLPIWDYGKKDRMVQNALCHMLKQLEFIDKEETYKTFLEMKSKDVKSEQTDKYLETL